MKKKFLTTAIVVSLISTVGKTDDLWDAAYYAEHSLFQERIALRALRNIRFRGNESILDIGCGEGKITAQIAAKVSAGTVLGLDISENMIQQAREKNTDIENLSFVLADAADFSFQEKFDFVFSFCAMHWVEDSLQMFKSIKNVLSSRGILVAVCSTSEGCDIEEAFNSLESQYKWLSAVQSRRQMYCGKTIKEYKELLDQAGFESINVSSVASECEFVTCQDLASWFFGWMGYCTKLTGADLENFCFDLAQEIYKKYDRNLTEPLIPSISLILICAL